MSVFSSAGPEANPYELAEALKDQLEAQIEELPTMSVCVNSADWSNKTIQCLREIVKTQGLIIKAQDLIIVTPPTPVI
jgi:hypothetical protein